MEKLATDIYTFEKLRNGGYTYVDKTAQILPLANNSIGTQFFIARPRRFGKSLLISTLHCLFEGRRDLFKGLAIEPKWDWSKSWPVLHLDMGSCQAETIERFQDKMRTMLLKEAERLGVALRDPDPSNAFSLMIDDLAAKSPDGQMVLLVDEYDKPLLGHLSSPDVTRFRNALKEFYSIIKTLEAKQRFTFITGVSKFSKVSIFSDLNNLKDRTMTPGEATLLGYTHDELKRFFPETLKKIGAANGLDAEGAFRKVVEWYGGYRFALDSESVVNPISFGLISHECKFQYYWINTTSLLETILKSLRKSPLDFSKIIAPQEVMEGYTPEKSEAIPLLFQAGYLTLDAATSSKSPYLLTFPNLEVEGQLLDRLCGQYSGCDNASTYQIRAIEALYSGDVEKFVKALKCFFANIPYNLTDRQNEQMWQTVVYVVLKAIGIAVSAEVMTNEGRIDMTCETPAAIWLIEFKLDRSADEALKQIEANGYAEKFDLAKKRVVRIGVAFSSEKRTITEVKSA